MNLPTICILAGGLGSRLGDRVGLVPKPLLEVAGKPFLEHQLELLSTEGATDVVLCVGYRGAMIEETFGREVFGLRLAYSYDGDELLGTLGAVRHAKDLLGEEFLILYGDTYLRIDYRAAYQSWRDSGTLGLMTVLRNDDQWDSSNAIYEAGRVVAYDKLHKVAGMRWIDYGLGGLRADALLLMPEESELANLYARLAATNELCGVEASTPFVEIGRPEALERADAFFRASD